MLLFWKLPTKRDAVKRYEYFDLIFCGREGSGPAHEHRMNVLASLCSLAIQFPCYLLFDDIAIWFMKIKSDVYAKRIVDQIVEDFVLTPDEYNLYTDLLPFRNVAFEFSCYFVVYSISEKNMCPQLVLLIGKWMAEDSSEILCFIAENAGLRDHFKDECVAPMISYDVKNMLDDDVHDKFHCALTFMLLQWRSLNVKNDESAQSFNLTVLSDLISQSDHLQDFQRTRLIQNVRNAYLSGHYSRAEFTKCISENENNALLRSGQLDDLMVQKL